MNRPDGKGPYNAQHRAAVKPVPGPAGHRARLDKGSARYAQGLALPAALRQEVALAGYFTPLVGWIMLTIVC